LLFNQERHDNPKPYLIREDSRISAKARGSRGLSAECNEEASRPSPVIVRKGSRFSNLAFPSGEPPAEGAVAFSTY